MVIYDTNYRVLVLQRKDDPDFWQSVTGTIEFGERALETAYREVSEELGIGLSEESGQIRDCQRMNQFKIRPEWQHRFPPNIVFNTENVFSLCITGKEEITLTEHLQYQWLTKESAMKKVWSTSNMQAIRDFVPSI